MLFLDPDDAFTSVVVKRGSLSPLGAENAFMILF
jgi:hypothetical protein